MDGIGWWMDLVGRVCYAYKWDRNEVLFEIDMVELWMWYNAAMELDGWLQFSGVCRKGDGYIRQEAKRNG